MPRRVAEVGGPASVGRLDNICNRIASSITAQTRLRILLDARKNVR
jgi:hypothetical protein